VLVTDNPSAFEDPYAKLKQHLIVAFVRSKWEKLDSLLSFPMMWALQSAICGVGLLNTLKPQSLEELFTAIYLQVLPVGYREHFSRC
jgi:hypothetical protein